MLNAKAIANLIAEYWYSELHGKIAPIFQKQKLAEFIEQKFSTDEVILCAAIHFDDGKKYGLQPYNIESGLVLCGWWHGCIFPQIGGLVKERQELGIFEKEQGFLTNKNRFVTREEAAEIALKAGQIKEPKNRLFSEDLY